VLARRKIQVDCIGVIRVVATRSEDGETVVIKAVNPSAAGARVEIDLKGDFTFKDGLMQCVAPGSLRALGS